MGIIINGKPLGVQSYTFRHFTDKNALAAVVKDAGFNTLEVCAVHVDCKNEQAVNEFLDTMKKEGITISSFGINWFDCEEDEARPYFEFCKRANIPVMGIMMKTERLPMIEKLCAEYGVKVALHAHGRHDPLGNAAALRDLLGKSSKDIGICLETCWLIDASERPEEIALEFKDRIYGAHIKDLVFDDNGEAVDVIVGTGLLNLPAVLKALKGAPLSYVTLEYEGEAEAPLDNVKKCVEYIKGIVDSL